MAYEHTVKVTEVPTSVRPPRIVDSAIPLFIGCSPINTTGDLTNVNRINLYHDYASAIAGEGLSTPENGAFAFTNSEAIHAAFSLVQVAPIMVVNVLDPTKHTSQPEADTLIQTKDGISVLRHLGILPDTVEITNLEKGDYVLTWTSTGHLQVNLKEGIDDLIDNVVTYKFLDPSLVTNADIIGGVDTSGKPTGIELINSAYSKTGLVIGQLVVPWFSGASDVAATMVAKSKNINSILKCMSLHDIPTERITTNDEAVEYKNVQNITDESQIALWPMTSLGGTRYNASIIQAVVTMRTDAENGGIPYVSPSNKSAPMDSAVLSDGTEVELTPDNTAYLNGQGICTFLNFDGWRTRGNNTACYPANTDAKDRFICVKRMFYWVSNTSILTDWKNLDAPINQRLIDNIQDTNNFWLNSLAGQGALVGSQNRVEVLAVENPLTNILNGHITYHWYLTPPTPAEVIEHVLELDVNNYTELLGG